MHENETSMFSVIYQLKLKTLLVLICLILVIIIWNEEGFSNSFSVSSEVHFFLTIKQLLPRAVRDELFGISVFFLNLVTIFD